jgi:hypothetical protein
VLAAAAAAGGTALLGREEALPLVAGGVVLALHAAAWSTASQTATLVVLPLVALGCAALAVPRQPAPAVPVLLAGLLATAHVGALGPPSTSPRTRSAACSSSRSLGPCSPRRCWTRRAGPAPRARRSSQRRARWRSPRRRRLAVLGARRARAAGARHRPAPGPPPVAVAGGLLLSASSWVRLADAGITAPEPYVLPLARGARPRRAAPPRRADHALVGGVRPLDCSSPSSRACSRGSTATTSPVRCSSASPRWRCCWPGRAAGSRRPLAVGAGVLVVVALDLLGPYAAASPRWLSLGSAGALLLVVGATYEQRRRDVARLRDGYERLA